MTMPPDDALDATALRARLSPSTAARYVAIDVVDAIDSTNSELLRRRTPERGIVALFAERQSGGRGRQGRVWASPPGENLYLSLARGFDGALSRLGGLSLAVGVAVAEALRDLGASGVALKWPNDLVVDDGSVLRKLGGILVEAGLQDGRARRRSTSRGPICTRCSAAQRRRARRWRSRCSPHWPKRWRPSMRRG
jgi:BirA family biotin operon repressor/biotin-[acetyl-CoA-carboxylase] ligase